VPLTNVAADYRLLEEWTNTFETHYRNTWDEIQARVQEIDGPYRFGIPIVSIDPCRNTNRPGSRREVVPLTNVAADYRLLGGRDPLSQHLG
jgi:hypothetical protein